MRTETLPPSLRKDLERTITDARVAAETGASAALGALAVPHSAPYPHMQDQERHLRRRLRAHARQLGDPRHAASGEQGIERLVHECAYEHWHGMLFARFLSENNLLIEPEMGVAVTLDDCEALAKEHTSGDYADNRGMDKWLLAARYAHAMLAQVFRADLPVFEVRFAQEHRQQLEALVEGLPAEVFAASDALGWVYQFWQSRRKSEVNRSETKIGADELPPVTQLFTEPYMVSFLLDNSLGAWWAAHRLTETDFQTAQSEAELRERAAIPGVPLEYLRFVGRTDADNASRWRIAAGDLDTWPEHLSELKLIDPCCGSGHFLVAAFAMLVPMRMAFEGLTASDAVDAVIRQNLYGLEIDARCVEIAVFALALAVSAIEQSRQLHNPLSKVTFDVIECGSPIESYAVVSEGLHTGDYVRFGRKFWELPLVEGAWELQQGGATSTHFFTGLESVIRWGDGQLVRFVQERLGTDTVSAWIKGKDAWNRTGVAINAMSLGATDYSGAKFTHGIFSVTPRKREYAAAIRAFCTDDAFLAEVRKLDQKKPVARESIAKVHFNLGYWKQKASEPFPRGLPLPYSNDLTQWIFHGHPCGSVQWDDLDKHTARGPTRIDSIVLQVVITRLLGYRWPVEQDEHMALAAEQREWVRACAPLVPLADEDGIVCIPALRGERPAAERLQELLAASYGEEWDEGVLANLLAAANGETLDDWLRNRFFEQHCKLFHNRPFIWHIWDGRKDDGFHALVNYHNLAAPEGDGRRCLESLAYSYLGDWITRQQDAINRDETGAEDRLAAAQAPQARLERILTGEPPHDIFVRWKPLNEQPIGWEPDINDGVRLNIRPFMGQDISGGKKGAGILRTKPNIHWRKDRGKEPEQPQDRFPWFWHNGEFTAERVNHVHLELSRTQTKRH